MLAVELCSQVSDLFLQELVLALELLDLEPKHFLLVDRVGVGDGLDQPGAGTEVLRAGHDRGLLGADLGALDVVLYDLKRGAHQVPMLLFNSRSGCITWYNKLLIQFRMSNKFSEAMQQRFARELESMPVEQDSNDELQQSDDYFQFERKKMHQALENLRNRPNQAPILEELKKNTHNQIEYLNQFEDEVVDLHNITRNNENNVLQESVIQEIKSRVFTQSALHSIHLADQELEARKSKEDVSEGTKGHVAAQKSKELEVKQAENRLNSKLERIKVERQLAQMAHEDDLSMKYEHEYLSNFFRDRFFDPVFELPPNRQTQVAVVNYAPKTTFTSLKPLPNTENNVLPKNAPELALRRLAKTRKIVLKPSSLAQLPVKVRKINQEQTQMKPTSEMAKPAFAQESDVERYLLKYLTFIRPLISKAQQASCSYKPKFINYFPNQNEQNYNIDNEDTQGKCISDCLQVDNPLEIKDIKLTYEHIGNLKGIQKYPNVQHASLQFNSIVDTHGIESCQKIIQLNLSYNQLKSISSLRALKWLRVANFEHNQIETLEFAGGSLQVLQANHNKITQIRDLSANTYLKRLVVSYNSLAGLSGMDGLFFLEELDLQDNQLVSLSGLQQCILLRVLNASSNKLAALHDDFTYIFLNRLLLSNNNLVGLPSMFLPSLQELYLNMNHLETETASTAYLPSLKLLNLDDNRLAGFSAVWSMLRHSRNLEALFYDRNEYFEFVRERVKELYEHIVYRSMRKLKQLNSSVFDIGIKKYYESSYTSYLKSSEIFKPQTKALQQVQMKINFMIAQNQFMSRLEDKKARFAETDIFVQHKSVKKIESLVEIVQFLANKGDVKMLHAYKSVFYEHDKFEYNFRDSLHKIRGLILRREHYIARRKKYYQAQKPKLADLFTYLSAYAFKLNILKAINAFHKPIEKMGEENAATIIQKNWRCYRMRKRYLKIMKKLKKKQADDDMEEIDLDEYNFDNVEFPEFNFELPEDMDFQQYIIRPQIFEMLKKQEQSTAKATSNSKGNQSKQQKPSVSSSIQNNTSTVSHQEQQASRPRSDQEQITRLMGQWGVSRNGAMAMLAKNKMKEARKKKEQEKHMTATQRYERFKGK